MKIEQLYNELKKFIPEEKMKVNEPLDTYTYTRVGGNADLLVFPTEYEEIQKIMALSYEQEIPVTILGNASNVIVRDSGIRGIVVNLTEMKKYEAVNNQIICQSGASIIDISGFALFNKLSGLEFACGIPGSIGGAVFMNAGAYGGEVSDVLESVLVVTRQGELLKLLKDELKLGYRTSVIPEKEYVVVEATFSLTNGDFAEMKAKMDHLTFLRESKQPLEFPSCGSVFKRPEGYFAGKLIQDSGLQGVCIGGAQVSEKHAGFIVNKGNATSQDYLYLINLIQKTVKDKFSVDLETEVRIIGE